MNSAELDQAIQLRQQRQNILNLLDDLCGSIKIEIHISSGGTLSIDPFTRGALTTVEMRDFLIAKCNSRLQKIQTDLNELGVVL